MKIDGIVPIQPEAALTATQSIAQNAVETLSIILFIVFMVWAVRLVFE